MHGDLRVPFLMRVYFDLAYVAIIESKSLYLRVKTFVINLEKRADRLKTFR